MSGQIQELHHNCNTFVCILSLSVTTSFHFAKQFSIWVAQAAEFVHAKLWDPESKRLRRSFRVGPSAAQGFADDYSYMIAGLLDLYQARGAPTFRLCCFASQCMLQTSAKI